MGINHESHLGNVCCKLIESHEQAVEKGDWFRAESSPAQGNRLSRGARRGGSPFFNTLLD
jgi:hypothetical protein